MMMLSARMEFALSTSSVFPIGASERLRLCVTITV